MIIPLVYYLVMAAWLPRTMLERWQFLAGLLIFTVCGPFINIAVLVFAVHNMDSFGWGKTRQVVADNEPAEEKGSLEEPLGESPSGTKSDGAEKTGRERRVWDEEAQIASLPRVFRA